MGSAASIKSRTNSKQLICPKDYSQKDFNRILLNNLNIFLSKYLFRLKNHTYIS